jgi:hypothetical protein
MLDDAGGLRLAEREMAELTRAALPVAPSLPDPATVFREQVGTTGMSLRREMLALGGILGFVTTFILAQWVRGRLGPGVELSPEGLAPLALLGFLAPLAVWKLDGPGRRGYLHAMPVDRVAHALSRVASGWVWLMAASAVYAGWLVGLSAATSGLEVSGRGTDAPWVWVAPYVGATVLYGFGSAIALVARHPWRWMAGGVVGFAVVSTMASAMPALQPLVDLVQVLWSGRFGLFTVITGMIDHVWDYGERVRLIPDLPAWLASVAVWGTASLAAVLTAARHQPEE